jgi:O-antigen/teichoic acid export membrane protein
LFQNIEKEESQIKSISSSLLALYAVIAILMTFFAPEIVRILATEEYYEAIYIMPPIATGIFLTSVAHMYSNILVYYKQTKYVMYASFIAAAVNLILNYIFIRIYGYMAAAYTTLVSYVLLVVFEVYWANKVSKSKNNYPIYEGKRIFVMSTITMVVSMSSLLFYGNVIIRYVSIGAITLIGILLLKKYFEEKNN